MFEQWVKGYQEHLVVRNYAPLTIETYLYPLKLLGDFLKERGIGDISQVTREVLWDFQGHVHGMVNTKGQPNSISRQNSYVRGVKFFFRYLVDENLLMGDPARGMKYAKEPKRLPRSILTKEEMRRLLQAPDTGTLMGYRDRTVLEVLYSTGIRRAEANNLLVTDVDYEGGYLRVNMGKGAKDRVVPMGKIACRYLENYIKTVRPAMLKDPEEKHLFLTMQGRKLSKQVLRFRISAYARKAKLGKRVSPHTFRHTCATLMMKNKANIRHIQELLGHASLNTTQVYTQVSIADLKEVHRRCHPREKEGKG